MAFTFSKERNYRLNNFDIKYNIIFDADDEFNVIPTIVKQVSVLFLLRAVAALMVMVVHLPKTGYAWLDTQKSMLWLGVEVFFVISGFVIPYSMHYSGYKLSHFGNFMVRRLIRIVPAAYLAVILLVSLHFLSIFYQGRPIEGYFEMDFSASKLFHNAFFTADFFKSVDWYLPIYWTLAIEFEYYLVIGLFFPLLIHPNHKVKLATFIFLLCCWYFVPLTGHGKNVLYHISIFMMGVWLFYEKTGVIKKSIVFYAGLALLFVVSYFQCGWPIAVTGLITSLIIYFFNHQSQVADFLGKISYSIYLIHVPVIILGQAAIKRVLNWDDFDKQQLVLYPYYFIIVFIAATVFYYIIERPSHEWSKKLKKKR